MSSRQKNRIFDTSFFSPLIEVKNEWSCQRYLYWTYREDAVAKRTPRKWFARFKHGKFDLNDDPHFGRPVDMDKDQFENLSKESFAAKHAGSWLERWTVVFAPPSFEGFHSKAWSFGVPHELTQKQMDKRLTIDAQNLDNTLN